MNIISRICEKHENDYNVMSDGWMEPVYLEFGDGVSADIQDRLERELDRLDVEVDPYECDLNLKLDMDSEGIYRLTRSGELLYRFANRAPGFLFPNYDIVQAIAWAIYAVASQNEKIWFRGVNNQVTPGAYISCQSFSAKQQAVASRIMRSVDAQSVSEIPENRVTSVVKQMLVHVEQFTESIPLFSYRPIREAAYKEYRGKTVEKKLGEIAGDLFGRDSFEMEITSYREFVRQNEAYADQVAKARKELTRNIYDLPIMVVSRFFTELNETIESFNKVSLGYIEELLNDSVRFSLAQEKLKNAFAEVDDFCAEYTRNAIRQDFLREVLEETRRNLNDEQLEARKICKQMRRELSRFCFVDAATFAENENALLLSWKQLMNLQESDLSMAADLRWSAETMIKLQSKLMNPEEPNCWLCMPALREKSIERQKTDQFNTQAVPLMDQRSVIAIWVRDYLK